MPSSAALLVALCAAAARVAQAAPVLEMRGASYAPSQATCPATSIIREATALSSEEAAYIAGRKPVADKALASWLANVDPAFASADKMPLMGLASSGGGHRALLSGAGVIQGFDADDTTEKTGGLFQALSYHVGLSGGAWLVAAIAANNWPTISSQMNNLWINSLNTGIIQTAFGIGDPRVFGYTQEMWQKKNAGFNIQIADPWGAVLADSFVYEQLTTFSSIANSSRFANFTAPYPILTATEVYAAEGQCYPTPSSLQYEISPFEFGSWDPDLHSFAQTEYLGSTVSGGTPSKCVTGYDLVSYVMGTASNLFNGGCQLSDHINLPGPLQNILLAVEGHLTTDMTFASYPNPFYQSNIEQTNTNVSSTQTLRLADDGETTQNNPIWPFIQPERPIDVVIVNDNSADLNNSPNGTEMHSTYLRAQQAGLTRMPAFPDPETFQPDLGRPWFFGCHNPEQVTFIYLPNQDFSFASNTSTYKLQYSADESTAMVANGVAVASQNGDPEWPTCLGCGIMQKTGANMPDACGDCLKKYCYN